MLKPFQLDMPISGTSKQFEELINKFFAFQFSFKIKIHLQRKIDSHFRIDSCLSFSSKSQHEMPFLNFAHFFCLHLWYQATISEALYETHIKKDFTVGKNFSLKASKVSTTMNSFTISWKETIFGINYLRWK